MSEQVIVLHRWVGCSGYDGLAVSVEVVGVAAAVVPQATMTGDEVRIAWVLARCPRSVIYVGCVCLLFVACVGSKRA